MASKGKNRRIAEEQRERENSCPLKHLPKVNASHAAKGLDPASLHASYQGLPMKVLLVRASVRDYIPVEPGSGAVHLDGLLAFAVEKNHPVPFLFSEDEANVLPVPLKLVWTSKNGLPLWAGSDLRPVGEFQTRTQYWHKRHFEDRVELLSKAPKTRAGRYKPYRIPMTLVESCDIAALAIGHRQTIESLLNDHVSHVGKKASQGWGRVSNDGWSVVALDDAPEEAMDHILERRPVPIRYIWEVDGGMPVGVPMRPQTWSPPYWWQPWTEGCVVRG